MKLKENRIEDSDGDTFIEVESGTTDDDVIKFGSASSFPQVTIDNNKLNIVSNHNLILDEGTATIAEGWQYRFQNNTLRFGERTGTVWQSSLKGDNSMSGGKNLLVQGDNGVAFGMSNKIFLDFKNGMVCGFNNQIKEDNATSFGQNNISEGLNSTTFGFENVAKENVGLAFGRQSISSKIASTAWGESSAIGDVSTTWGNAIANGNSAAAWGLSESNGNYSIAWGHEVEAFSINEIALGTFNEEYTPSSSSQDKLFVVGNGESDMDRSTGFEILKDNSARYYDTLSLHSSIGSNVVLGLKEETNGTLFGFEFELDGQIDKLFLRSRNFSGNDAIRMTFDHSGRTGIGRTPTTNRMEINGNASKSVPGPFLGNSDKRLKENIQALNSQAILEKILQMEGVNYEWNDPFTKVKRPQGEQTGFIAQDLQEIWPENVSVDNMGYLQAAYGDLDPYFVSAFKAHQRKIDAIAIKNSWLLKAQSELLIRQEKMLDEISNLESWLDEN